MLPRSRLRTKISIQVSQSEDLSLRVTEKIKTKYSASSESEKQNYNYKTHREFQQKGRTNCFHLFVYNCKQPTKQQYAIKQQHLSTFIRFHFSNIDIDNGEETIENFALTLQDNPPVRIFEFRSSVSVLFCSLFTKRKNPSIVYSSIIFLNYRCLFCYNASNIKQLHYFSVNLCNTL